MNSLLVEMNRRPQRRHEMFLFCSYCEKRKPKSIFCLLFFGKVVNVSRRVLRPAGNERVHSIDCRLDPSRAQTHRQNTQRPRQGSRPFAIRRDRSPQRPPPPQGRRDRDRRRISRHRTAAACRRRQRQADRRRRRWSAMSGPAPSRISMPTDRGRSTRSTRRSTPGRPRSRSRSAAIRSARCSTTGSSSTTTSAIRRTRAWSGACASAAFPTAGC